MLWKINPVYRNENRPGRGGVCYIVRKGHEKPRLPATETSDAICIDGMSHEEVNDVFNRCDTFYSYDEATMYSQFAALCGCTSIIVPGFYDSQEAWIADHDIGRYGVAYGESNIAHARATRHLVEPMLREKEEASRETVRNFVQLTRARFRA